MNINKKSFTYFNYLTDSFLITAVYIFVVLILDHRLEVNIHINIMFGVNLLWIYFANRFGIYEDYRSRPFTTQLVSLLKTNFVLVIFLFVVFFVLKGEGFNRKHLVYFSLIFTLLIGCKYYLLKKILKILRKHGKNQRHILLIGAGDLGLSFIHSVESNLELGYKIVGVLDDDQERQKEVTNYLGDIERLEPVLNKLAIDDVVIALPNYAMDKLIKIVRLNNKYGKRTRILPDYSRFLTSNYQISVFGDYPVITIRKEPLEEVFARLIKRLFDVVFSSFVIVFILSWLSIIIWLVNKLYSPGPLLFVQDRIGKDNKSFKCFKFRTMHFNKTANNAGFTPTTKNDDRISKIGKILRKTNIDELPQFINVFNGTMSVVGPRPHAIAFNDKYAEYVEEIRLRHRVKPGITGWAQINGARGDVVDEKENKKRTRKRIELDIWYIEHWSFSLDIQIIFLTVWNMLRGDPNAY